MTGCALQHLDFDSAIFGRDVLRVVRPDSRRVQAELQEKSGALMVDAKLSSACFDQIAAFERLGFRRVATLITLEASPLSEPPEDIPDRSLQLSDNDLKHHAEGFVFQRFRQDSMIDSELAKEFMRLWITNSLAGRRETLARGSNFCTYCVTDQTLVIDLLSVIEPGRGIAGQLLQAIRSEGAARSATRVRVTTEAENSRALHSYVNAGFVPVMSETALHLVRDDAG
ncbi:GNAT family N-acetyltransferase [Ruegeria sp. Ofav3-42]|uniref:GNAT family N-acetyltransferase n=1 Tax=Ruegeria sp. Ofav3-42 TaxID=2917759 RepID=UPI001EF75263|nr:hypothetical protein [Ruegeria sp. Ofav3-42]MCG7522019.1 hypothetical protein [Ruegeria sp. Ofav3-42]